MLRNDVRRCLPPPPAYTFFIHYDGLLVLDDATSSDKGRALQKVNDNIHDIYSIVSVLRSELYRNVHLLLVVLLNILLDYFAHRVVYDVVVFANIIPPSPRRIRGGREEGGLYVILSISRWRMLGVGGKCFFDFFRYDNKAYAICDDGQQIATTDREDERRRRRRR